MSKAAKKLIVSAVAVSAIGVGSASASMINYNVSGPNADASDEQAFFNKLRSGTETTETFEGFVNEEQKRSFGTSVGKFRLPDPENDDQTRFGQSCEKGSFVCGDGLGIVNVNEFDEGGYFDGRHPLPEQEGNEQYLDSLDHEEVIFDVDAGNNAVGFFLTDPNDANGLLDIALEDDGGQQLNLNNLLDGWQADKGSFYFSVWADADIESITFMANNDSDGFGVDNVTTGRVPEPGTLALLGLGLVGLGVSRKRAK